jgi:hypothetical protein
MLRQIAGKPDIGPTYGSIPSPRGIVPKMISFCSSWFFFDERAAATDKPLVMARIPEIGTSRVA